MDGGWMDLAHVGTVLGTAPHGHVGELSAAGVRRIELGLFETWGGEGPPGSGFAAARQFARECDAAGIAVQSVHAPFAGMWDLARSDARGRTEAVEAHARLIEWCAVLASPVLVVHPGDALTDAAEDASRRAAESLAALAPLAEFAGITLAVENMPPGYVCCSPLAIAELVRAVDHPSLGSCLDTGHAHIAGGDAPAGVATLAESLVSLHLHDNDGSSDQHLLPGRGTIDWPRFAAALADIGYDGRAVLELRAPDGLSPVGMIEAFEKACGL